MVPVRYRLNRIGLTVFPCHAWRLSSFTSPKLVMIHNWNWHAVFFYVWKGFNVGGNAGHSDPLDKVGSIRMANVRFLPIFRNWEALGPRVAYRQGNPFSLRNHFPNNLPFFLPPKIFQEKHGILSKRILVGMKLREIGFHASGAIKS